MYRRDFETATVQKNLKRENVGVSLTVTPCWCYGLDNGYASHYTKSCLGFNGTERPGAVYLAAVLVAHAQKSSLLGIMAEMFKMLEIQRFQKMFEKNY